MINLRMIGDGFFFFFRIVALKIKLIPNCSSVKIKIRENLL